MYHISRGCCWLRAAHKQQDNNTIILNTSRCHHSKQNLKQSLLVSCEDEPDVVLVLDAEYPIMLLLFEPALIKLMFPTGPGVDDDDEEDVSSSVIGKLSICRDSKQKVTITKVTFARIHRLKEYLVTNIAYVVILFACYFRDGRFMKNIHRFEHNSYNYIVHVREAKKKSRT